LQAYSQRKHLRIIHRNRDIGSAHELLCGDAVLFKGLQEQGQVEKGCQPSREWAWGPSQTTMERRMVTHEGRSRRGGRAAEGMHPGTQVERSVTRIHLEKTKLTSAALDLPFLLLPFRPTSDPSASRTFVRNYFLPQTEREEMRGETLKKELRLTEPMVIQP
jgi:hypothetical protein